MKFRTGPMDDLEYGRILEDIAARTRSAFGRTQVLDLRPIWEKTGAGQLARETGAAASLIASDVRISADGNDELLDICSALEDGVLVLDPSQLRIMGKTLETQRKFLLDFDECRGETPSLESLDDYVEQLPDMTDLSDHLLKITTPEGDLSPAASNELARLQKQVEKLKRKMSSRIEGIHSSLSRRNVLRDMPPTMRDGRYVLPVIASRKGDVKGIIHDRSESGETIFIEPASLVEDGNLLREASLDMDYEKRRILRDASARVRTHAEELAAAGSTVAKLDAIFARADYHRDKRTIFPAEGKLSLVNLRHPLIPDDEIVRNTVTLPDDWKVLIISGPNAGGKSVLLKAVGLAVVCAQSGIGACVEDGSTIPFFGMLYVSIGDRQSIARHQSTYSARLQEQLSMLESGGSEALALIDEPSAGTDPLTGSALAAAVLERLGAEGFRVIVTTHQGQLKSLAQGRSGFYNGCMNFQSESLEPDYTFLEGIPGSSFTLEIARRMAFPEDVLCRAEELAGDSFRLDRMLEEVASERKRLSRRLREIEERNSEDRRITESRIAELDRSLSELEEEKRRYTEELRRIEKDINSRADSLLARLAQSQSSEERRELRERLREIAASSKGSAAGEQIVDPDSDKGDIEVGDWVSVKGWSGSGLVEEVGKDYVAVTLGNLRLKKPLSDVDPVSPPEEKASSAGWSSPVETDVKLDLRGLSADEALMELDRALEDGLVSGMPFIRVIHGKGKGILMKAVVDMAKRDSRIVDFRPGKPNEGGTGVTIVFLTKPGGQD